MGFPISTRRGLKRRGPENTGRGLDGSFVAMAVGMQRRRLSVPLAVLQLCSEKYVPRDACALDSLRSFSIAACLPFQRWSPVYVGQSVCPPVGHERRQHVLRAFVTRGRETTTQRGCRLFGTLRSPPPIYYNSTKVP